MCSKTYMMFRRIMCMVSLQLPSFSLGLPLLLFVVVVVAIRCTQVAQKCCLAVLLLYVVLLVNAQMCVPKKYMVMFLVFFLAQGPGPKLITNAGVVFGVGACCCIVGQHKHVCSKTYDVHDVVAAALFFCWAAVSAVSAVVAIRCCPKPAEF